MANIKDLNPNKKNPRKISGKKLDLLRKSLEKFGDLSGFVYNVQSKTLVSGHQRQKALEKGTIKVEVHHEKPTPAGTVAEGYALVNGERFKYREVSWDAKTETEALLAANRHSGDWDQGLLKLVMADMPGMDMELAGFELEELGGYGQTAPPMEYQQMHPVEEAFEEEQTDEQYLRDNPGPDTAVHIERPPSTVNYEATEEKMESSNVKHIVIIDCPSKEIKEKVRDLLRAEKFDHQHGVKIY